MGRDGRIKYHECPTRQILQRRCIALLRHMVDSWYSAYGCTDYFVITWTYGLERLYLA